MVAENGEGAEWHLCQSEIGCNRLRRHTLPSEEQTIDVVARQAHKVGAEVRGGPQDAAEPLDITGVTANLKV